jgi:hypothetical protein
VAEKFLTIAFLAAISLSGLAITAISSGSHTSNFANELQQHKA